MNRFTFLLLAGAVLVSLVFMTGTAQEDLIGDTVSWDRIFAGSGGRGATGVVGAGLEFSDSNFATIDISGNSIRFY